MNILSTLRGMLFGDPRRTQGDFHAVAERVSRVPPAELAVAEAALANGGPIADRIIEQLRRGGEGRPTWGRGDVWRNRAADGSYELRISTYDDLSIRDVPRGGWVSDWIPVVARPQGRAVQLQVIVFDAGIAGLLGRTADGARWPDRWRVDDQDLAATRSKAPWLTLPTPQELRAARAQAAESIGAWLENPTALRGRGGVMRVEPAASDAAIDAFEQRERFTLPEAYRSLLRRADGFEVGRRVVLGTQDAYRLDMPGPARLVIAPPNEDGALTLAESGEVFWIDLESPTTDGKARATNLRAWLLTELGGRTRLQSRDDRATARDA